jgi:iron-sulfur cluster assembly protein
VIPEKDIPSDAASPQVAAKPPKPPRAEKPKPRLRATKAALTLVRVANIFYPGMYADYLSADP